MTALHGLLLTLLVAAVALGVLVGVKGDADVRRYIVKRVALTVPMVLLLGSLVFVILRILPGDPTQSSLLAGIEPSAREDLRANLGLDRSLLVQYGQFLGNALTLNFGESVIGARRPIAEELGERFPATLELAIPAWALAALLGVALGTIAARRRGSADVLLRTGGIVVYALPSFWLGLQLQLLFGVVLGWLPVSGRLDPAVSQRVDAVTNSVVIDSVLAADGAAFVDALSHLLLPVATMTVIFSAVYLRLARILVSETLAADYSVAARSRGIPRSRITYRYALRNALIPLLTLAGLQFALLLGSTVIIETVFSWPGVGQYLVERIVAQDYPAVEATVVVFAALVALVSLLVDLLYAAADPRVRIAR